MRHWRFVELLKLSVMVNTTKMYMIIMNLDGFLDI